MVDTQRTKADLIALLADNTAGEISPQDGRDVLTSVVNDHAEIYITAGVVTPVVTVNVWYEVTAPTWTLTVSPAAHNFTHGTNGRLQYAGAQTRAFHCAASFSVTAEGNNKVFELALGINGTVNTPSIIRRKIATGADIGTGALHGFLLLSNSDYISMFIRNISDATDLTVELANMFPMGMLV